MSSYAVIDTHAHLEEMDSLPSVIERARQSGVLAIVAVGSERKSNQRSLEIAAEYTNYVFPALGLHPGVLGGLNVEEELRYLEDHVGMAVGVGEIGLDYHKRAVAQAAKDVQRAVLADLLSIAREHSRPAIIHSRYAWRDSFETVRDSGVDKAVFHWYTGPTNVLEGILGQQYYVSATLAVEYHAEHRRAVKETPLDQLLLETDSPVLYRGHQAEPADVARCLTATADLTGRSPEEVAAATTRNAAHLFRLPLTA